MIDSLHGVSPEVLAEYARKCSPAALAANLTKDEPEHARFQWPDHIDLISRTVVDAVSGRTPYVVINTPPQHSKSTTVSKWTPVWFLENWPYKRVILGSYSGDYAERWGRATRDTIDQYQSKLGVRVSPATSAAGEWETTSGGGMVAAGVGGAVNGRGADLEIIDDPHKDAAEANSPTIREKVWQWFTSVMMTRRAPNCPVFIIHTRWHPDDLTGRIEREMERDPKFPRFKILNLKAIAERDDPLGRKLGSALWTERYDVDWLEQQKRLVGTYWWNALYMGRPTAPEGGYFKRDWFDVVHPSQVPNLRRSIRFWDLAGTVEGEKGNNDPDYTVGLKMGISEAGVIFVTGLVRGRWSKGGVEARVKSTAKMDGPGVPVRMQQDPGQAGKNQVYHYQKLLAGYDLRGIVMSDDKVTRSGPFNAAAERGEVKLVEGAWNEDFRDELGAFPNGGHDDIVDAATGAYNQLMHTTYTWDRDSLQKTFSYTKKSVSFDDRFGFQKPVSLDG